jgi:antitoxin (DNA-binding transcriptional repressor) of toxin-antitoxin stability system
MDAVEHGQSFTVTRDGHQIGQLIPIRRKRRFVSRREFAAMSRNAPVVDLEAFRADQDTTADHEANRRASPKVGLCRTVRPHNEHTRGIAPRSSVWSTSPPISTPHGCSA